MPGPAASLRPETSLPALADLEPHASICAASSQHVPKILLLIDGMFSISDGGTERQLLQLVGIARDAGLAPVICVLRGTRWLTPAIAQCPVQYFSIESLGSLHGLKELQRLYRWMERERFAILQNFFTDANLVGPLLGRCTGIRVILGTRRSLNHGVPRPSLLFRLLARVSNRLTTRVLTNADAVSRCMEKTEHIPASKLTVIYNGVDTQALRVPRSLGATIRKSLHVDPDHLLIGNVSGLRPIKGVDLFIHAAALAHAQDAHLRFVVIGEGNMRPQLEKIIWEYRLGGIVTLAGAQEDVRPWLAAMDIGVLCSEAEGLSNSLLEYMASGIPAIATAVGGNREALGDAGLLVPPGDRKSLAKAMIQLSDPRLRKQLAKAGRERAEIFSLTKARSRMAELYKTYCPQLQTQTRA